MQLTKTITLLLFLLLVVTWGAHTQEYSALGSVKDGSGNPIVFANVLALKGQDSTFVKGAITQEDGVFELEALPDGEYLVRVSFVGFEDALSGRFTIDGANVTIPTITLQESAENLGEVTVTGRRPIIQRKADRLIFNVENSILSSGSSYDILKKTPGVIVSQGELLVRNQQVTVYINDRRVQLTSEELETLLENYSGQNIIAVEVITNPPARYEAEGGPILNIVTSKNLATGYKGSVEGTGTYAVFPKYRLGTSHYFKTDKLNLFFNYSFNTGKFNKEDNNRINYIQNGQIVSRWDGDFRRITRTNAHSANMILDYNLDSRNTLSLAVTGLLSPDQTFANTHLTEIRNAQRELDSTFRTNSDLENDRSNIAADLQYVHRFKKEGGQLSSNVHYTSYNFDRIQDVSTRYFDASGDFLRNISFNTDATQDIEIYTGQLDMTLPLGETILETGGKVSVIDSRSAIGFFDIQNGNSALDSANSDDFLYDENVYAGYFSLSRDWEKWSIKAGLRAEQTESVGNSLVLDEVNDLSYFELFPTAYVQFAPNDNHSFSIDYGRRITRPRYQDLNPFAYFLNENSFNRGNPNLRPAISNALNLNYTLNEAYSFDLYYRDNGNYISTLPFQDNDNFTFRSIKQNVLESTSYGFDFYHARYVVGGWYTIVYVSLFHEDETFLALESGNVPVENEVDGFHTQIANYFSFSGIPNFSANISFTYTSEFLYGSYKEGPTANMSVGLRQSLWNNRAVLTLASDDLLGRANARLTSRYLNQDNSFKAVPETQFIRFGVKYNFGNFRLEDNERQIEKKERERLEGE